MSSSLILFQRSLGHLVVQKKIGFSQTVLRIWCYIVQIWSWAFPLQNDYFYKSHLFRYACCPSFHLSLWSWRVSCLNPGTYSNCIWDRTAAIAVPYGRRMRRMENQLLPLWQRVRSKNGQRVRSAGPLTERGYIIPDDHHIRPASRHPDSGSTNNVRDPSMNFLEYPQSRTVHPIKHFKTGGIANRVPRNLHNLLHIARSILLLWSLSSL